MGVSNISNIRARDYDKEPIIIEDYNPLFKIILIFEVTIWFFFIAFTTITDSWSHSKSFWFAHFIGYSLVPTIAFYFYLKKAKRKVILKNTYISYLENEKVLESIAVDNIVSIKRTFNDFYLKEQERNPSHTIRIFLGRLMAPLEYFILIINKFLFHLAKNGLKNYKLFDAILLISLDNRVINILTTNQVEYKMVEEYIFEKKAIEVINTDVFIKFDYIEEEKSK